jgi:3',5'-cyclic AMP phosphodiesterase CpdA
MRIAHFSDLHVLDLVGVSPHRFLNKRLSGYANLRLKRNHVHKSDYVRAIAREITRAKIDHVAITGDITNLALETEFRAAKQLLEDELGLSPHDVSVVPGNHDLYTRGAMRGRRFAEYFHAYTAGDLPEIPVKDLGLGVFPYVRLRGPCAIIGLSSAVPRPPFVASGELGKRQLQALARALAHPEVKKRTPVVLVHHPAHNPASRLKALLEGLWDADALAQHLGQVPRGLILHGHLHRRQERALVTDVGAMRVVGATSASLHAHPGHEHARMAGFNLYEIDADGAITRVEAHVLDPETSSFSVAAVPLLA